MKIEIITREEIDGTKVDYVLLINEDGSYTSMLKSTYNELSALEASPK